MAGLDFAGSDVLGKINQTQLTDAATTTTLPVDDCNDVGTLLIDVISNKGLTVDVARYLDKEKTLVGAPATQGVVADAGPSGTFKYSLLGCEACLVTFTKTEAGSSTTFAAVLRGAAD